MTLVVADDFPRNCAEVFVNNARDAIAERGRFVVALTGGSTPGPIHRALAAEFRDRVEWAKVIVLFGDERAVPPNDKLSNYCAAHESLLAHVPATVHRMEGERSDLHAAARDYQAILERVGPVDLMFVGVGKDAHVLSLYPGSPQIDERTALVVAAIDPPMDPAVSRITMTPAAVEQTRELLVIVSGAEKREAVRRAISGPDDPHHVPVHLVRHHRNAQMIVDAAAAPT
jgi:6-phosphogluconolactonase